LQFLPQFKHYEKFVIVFAKSQNRHSEKHGKSFTKIFSVTGRFCCCWKKDKDRCTVSLHVKERVMVMESS